MKNWVAWLSAVVGVLVVAMFVWPTPYRYEDGGLARVNRFSGVSERAGVDGWVPVSKGTAADLTAEIERAFGEIALVSQDFDTVTVKNPTEWTFVLVENAEADFDSACGGASDYVGFATAERPIDPRSERTLHLTYPERVRKSLAAACGNGKHVRSLLLILNSASHPDGRHWDNVRSSVTRKLDGTVDVPGA